MLTSLEMFRIDVPVMHEYQRDDSLEHPLRVSDIVVDDGVVDHDAVEGVSKFQDELPVILEELGIGRKVVENAIRGDGESGYEFGVSILLAVVV